VSDESTKTPEKPKTPEQKVTRGDIEAKLRELRGEVDTGVDAAKAPVLAIAIGAAVAVVVVAYWMGRRRGLKKNMIFEIRRF
jgi:hypothetical protein